VDMTGRCGGRTGSGFSVAVYSAPDPSNENFGFFEAAEESDITFDKFMAATLKNNGSRHYDAETVNTYTTYDGRVIKFQPDHGVSEWGITSISPPVNVPVNNDQWHLARGDIVFADGSGCVVIKNPALQFALILDLRNGAEPKRTLKRTAQVASVTCDSP
jgi:hypothetical protein